MNWICSLIVFQYTILLLQGRPETSTSSMPEKITLEMEHPSSVSEILTTLESGLPSEIVSADTKKHLSANVAISTPSQTTKRVMSTTQSRKNEPIKKATKAPELVISSSSSTISTASSDMDFIAKTTRLIEELNAKQKSHVTTTPKADPVTTTTANAEKPTIYDIITETEKNHTLFSSRNQQQSISSSTVSPPLALPLSSKMPMQNQRSDDTPKAIGHHVEMHHKGGHPGIAEPLTWQQLESEMSMVDQNLKDSSTSKDGISTWILLSGSDKQPSMVATPATTTIAHVEKVDIKDDRQNYRFGHADKIVKPVKNRESVENKKPKPDKKNKIPTSTAAPKTTSPLSTTSGILTASDFMSTEQKNRRKGPMVVKAGEHKLRRKLSTTTTAAPIISHEKVDNMPVSAEVIETTTPVSFIVLEPKIAGFDLPQDRSPGTTSKKPSKSNANKNKRKPAKKNKVTAVTKTPLKNKDKPISTTIYNYLSREVMPSVGILGAGILLTGIASYFLSPFGALRRSYDEATDRQDNVDSIYSVNNEEYASAGSDSGQHEEEVFSKFLQGMPYRDVPRYVKYFKPDQQHPNQAMGPNHAMGPYRQQVRVQPQASNVVPKYSPYMRYRTAPSPHYNSAQYNPQQSYPTYRNHQMSTQPAVQPQPASPVYNPQFHEMQKQKSFANNMDTILKHQTIIYGKATNENAVEEKSIGSDIQAEADDEKLPQAEGQISDINENETMEDVAAQMQRRTNTYVVGSAITDTQPGEAVVSASMTASIDGLPSKGIVEPVITVTASSHGPRRRREIDAVTQKSSNKTIEHENQQPSSSTTTTTTTTAPPTQSTRLYSATEYSNLVSEYNMLREKFMSFDRDYSNAENEKKVEKKMQAEFKSITTDHDALKKAVDGANAIETFEKQVRIRAKNYELSVVLRTGIATLRQRIKVLNELVEHPEDDRIIEKINRRNGSTETSSTSNSTTTTIAPELDNGFVGFLKLLQLKAQFGLNLLQNIRPSFERAFEEVFKRPYEKLH
ncbi:uncharacterized protein LOC116350783 [Contarinia nasturtii]|uniref:uncharacterized protein LOC116350783 n=1 Tax=Contarinia nasturtii TaxID=265458 RepID=UPI0012D468C9|nr:uncharacterized protein LOC116350783 [Contarinia nasturtii]